jgi:diguanylate cyclase (GGDEF)-like protein/PAS domain S-box-containing protein
VVLVFRDQTADRDRMRALEERERRYASLAQAAPVGILRMDKQSRVVFCNDRLGEIVGMSKEAIAREGVAWVSNHTHPEDRPRVDAAFRAAARSGEGVKLLFRSILPDGSVVWVKVVMAPERDGEGQIEGFVLIVADVTDDQRHLERIDHLAKLYATLSQINHAIVHSAGQEALFQEVCRVAVASGGVSTAWIFNADQAGNRLILGAMAGEWVTDELRQRLQTIDLDPATPMAQTLTARVAREGRRHFSNDSGANFEAAGFTPGTQACGSGSLAAVPIKQDGRTVAVLGLLAMETGYFNPDMLALIDEIGEDISYALQNLEQEQLRRAAEERLRNQEERLRLALEASGLGCYELDVTNDRVLLDGVYARMLGLEPQAQEMPIKTYLDYCFPTPEQRQIVREALSARKDGRFSAEQKFLRPDGKLIWIQRRGAVVAQQPDGAPLRILATAADMTARHDMEEHLRMMAMVFENSRDAVIITDADANIVMVNPAFSQVTGYTPAEVMGKNPRILGSGRQTQTYYRTLWRNLRENGFWQGELWNQRKNGEQYPSLSAISAVRQGDGTLTHYVGLSRDITQQKESEARITKLAYRDALTDLPNRLLLRDRADLGLASAHRDGHTMALLFVDLDHFKNINDSLGHAIGDRLLVEVARRMRAALREMDTVGRLGGDEFLLLLPDADADAAAHVAQKLLTEVAKPVRIDAHTLTVTPSVGISLFPKDGRSFDELMKSADTAMYRAKERGRNTYHFADAEMNQAVFQRLVLESSLRRAIEGGELVLFYQPQYTVADQCLIGVEALLRWKQPELGFVSPGQFIPVAEESGLIEPIGAWVLGEVCRQVVRWRNQGVCAGRVGVNFSARQFAAPNLIQVVDQALAASGLTGDCLEAEITESLLVGDLDSVLEVLHAFKARGIHVAVDDFGTGYSSLSYLKRFPIDRLKIDQSFIRDLDDRAIATAVVTLGHSLGMRVIAEGVETTEQLAILQEIGCDEAQGFHLGRPMPAPELSRLLSPLEIPA